MNYRQWKKAYKKRYGVNPPDKRKANKNCAIIVADVAEAITRCSRQIAEDLTPAIRAISENLIILFEDIQRALSKGVQQ